MPSASICRNWVFRSPTRSLRHCVGRIGAEDGRHTRGQESDWSADYPLTGASCTRLAKATFGWVTETGRFQRSPEESRRDVTGLTRFPLIRSSTTSETIIAFRHSSNWRTWATPRKLRLCDATSAIWEDPMGIRQLSPDRRRRLTRLHRNVNTENLALSRPKVAGV